MIKDPYLKVTAILLFIVSPILAQENATLHGTISAPFLENASVHIINSTQRSGTVNSASGSFQILVKENDELLFSSIQYKNVTVRISSEIIKKGILDIVLTEELNVLDEVNISNNNLSGNINSDIANMKVLDDLPLNYGLSDIKNMIFKADRNDSQKAPRNRAFESNEIMEPVQGGAIISIDGMFNKEELEFLAFVSASKSSNKELRYLFQDYFFINTLKLKEGEIDDFIYYAIDNGLNDLIKKSNKLTVTEFLIKQSKNYRKKMDSN